MRNEFYFASEDGKSRIHAVEWIPQEEAGAVLQICHGMTEYIKRYEEFASFLCGKGYYVVGHDHLGHGGSVRDKEDYGFFHETKGNQYMIADIHRLRERTQEKYPKLPYFLMGHSMGSFLVRQYLTMYGKGLGGAILMGTAHKSQGTLLAGRLLCRAVAAVKGWRYRSSLINNLGLGRYSRGFEACEGAKAWVTSDKEKREEYENDPLCSFIFTVSGYYQMFEGMKKSMGKKNARKLPKELPILLVSGEDDPVGGRGAGVRRVYREYKEAGLTAVAMKLYPNDRHELLNERNKGEVFEDLYKWLKERER